MIFDHDSRLVADVVIEECNKSLVVGVEDASLVGEDD